MSNQKRLEEYLVGEDGYLRKDISNGKVIMLSGKWGSGKTHFWKNIIATDELKKELSGKNSAYSYVSLYGKSSIEEIENDIFAQTYFSAIGGDNIVTKTFSTFTKYSKRYGEIFSDKVKNLADGMEKELKENQERVALERLKNGAIICFDDFERKSKAIDLNDLFGFITQLTLNFSCKVVIILNDDVFEGEEKKIFSNVKEKSVSKFLKYEPSIKDLFNLIFYGRREDDKKKFKYLKLRKYKQIILKTIEETEELNARIYIQVLDNLVEWIEKNQEKNDDVLRCLILVNINFVLNHIVFRFDNYPKEIGEKILPTIFFGLEDIPINGINSIRNIVEQHAKKIKLKLEVIDKIKIFMRMSSKNESKEELLKALELMNKYEDLIWLFWKFEINLEYRQNILNEQLNKINNFIETGILINE